MPVNPLTRAALFLVLATSPAWGREPAGAAAGFDALIARHMHEGGISLGAFAFDLYNADSDSDGDGELDSIAPEGGAKPRRLATLAAGDDAVMSVAYRGAADVSPRDVRVTALIERDGSAWRLVASHWSEPVDELRDAVRKRGYTGGLPGLAPGVGAGAKEVAELFRRSLGDRAVLLDSLSARPDVFLFFAGASVHGGKRVKEALARAAFDFDLVGEVRSGLTSSGKMAWAAAHVNGLRAEKGAVRFPYRVLFIYQQSAGRWRLVGAHLSILGGKPILPG
jgi:hypothetical protein